jgi:hypothetical protein
VILKYFLVLYLMDNIKQLLDKELKYRDTTGLAAALR